MKHNLKRLSALLLCTVLMLFLTPSLLPPALAEDGDGDDVPFGDVGIVLPTEATAEVYKDEAPRSGVNYYDFGDGDFMKSIYLEYSVMGGRNFTKRYVNTGTATLVASPGETITIAYTTAPDWPFAIPWAKENENSPDFEDLYTFENYVESYAYYVSNTLKPEYVDREVYWDSASAYEEAYLIPKQQTVFSGKSYSGSISIQIPTDIDELVFIPQNDTPPTIRVWVQGVCHLKPFGEDVDRLEGRSGVGLGLTIYLDFEYKEPVSGLVQEETAPAETGPGEDEGTVINQDIVEGGEDKTTIPEALLISIAGIGGSAAAAALLSGDGKNGKKKKRSTYKMHINKNFGNVIKKGGPPCWVYARIIETMPDGREQERPDLTKLIVPFSGDGNLTVESGGMTSNGYMAAHVTAPKGTTSSTGRVSFQFQGKGGYFTEHVIFSLSEARINFGQENLGLPAHYDKKVYLFFTVSNMPENMQVTAEFPEESKAPYKVQLLQDPKEPRCFCAVLEDVSPKDEAEPGTTRTYRLKVRAQASVTGPDGKTELEEVERDFDVLRIFMGLVLQLEGDAIGCYLKIKDGRQEMASKRAAGSNLGLDLTSGAAAINPMNTMINAGMDAMIGATVANDIREEDKEPCYTQGTLLLLNWNDETQQIERIAVLPQPKVEVKALRVDNDKNSMIGAAEERHQELVKKLDIQIFCREVDQETGGRKVWLLATKAGLDRPTRLRAELTVRAVYNKQSYEVKKKVLLHSMPFRAYVNETARQQQLGFDERVRKFLEKMCDEIWDHYMNRLSSLYYLARRMMDGYDENFGYDQKQLDRVCDYWIKFRRGQVEGKNGETYKVSIKDDLAACVAFVEGMRDNGGIIGRIALGVCTAGYSEVLFFGMDLHDKMKEAVFACKDNDFGFWDGVALGVKEYEKQVAMELLVGGALKLGNYGVGKLTGIDLGATISKNWRAAMDAADKSLRNASRLYKCGARTLDGVIAFTNGGAAAYKEAMDRAAKEDLAAEAKATTIAQRRMGDLGLSPEQMRSLEIHDLSMKRGMDNLNELWARQRELAVARKAGNLAEAQAAYEEAWLKAKFDKNTFKQLKNYTGPEGQTIRAKFTEVRKAHDARIMERILDDVSAETGIPRNELYIETVSGHADAWKETAGLTLPEDVDMNVRQIVYSGRDGLVTAPNANYSAGTQDIIVAQKIGENALVRNVYKEFHGGMDAPSLKAAKEFTAQMDYTYVQPWQGLEGDMEITFNQEAYIELDKVINPAHFDEALKAKKMNQLTVEHKAMEWKNRAEKLQARADALEQEAAKLTGEAKQAKLDEAMDLRCTAHGQEVESVRQLTKAADNTIAPRSEYRDGQGLGASYTTRAKEMVAMGKQVQKGGDPHAFFDNLRTEHGVDYRGAVREVAACLE